MYTTMARLHEWIKQARNYEKNLFVQGISSAKIYLSEHLWYLSTKLAGVKFDNTSEYMALVPRTSNWKISLSPTIFTCPGQ